MNNYDNQVLGTQNSLHPFNEVTVLDDSVEQMTELEFAEYERNLYQARAKVYGDKLKEIQSLCNAMSDEIGWKIMILKVIEKKC